MDKVTPKQLEIKMAGQALECGTLAVLLSLLQPHTLVFLSPLTLASSYDGQYKQDYLIHVTARPSHTSPILYASFQAAQTVRLADKITLLAPCRLQGKEAETRAQQLQNEMQHCLWQLIKAHTAVSRVVLPARLRLPDEWAWSARSQEPRIRYQDEHWIILAEGGNLG